MIILNTLEALNIFNIEASEFTQLDKRQLRKKYIMLMKKYHPDRGGRDTNLVKSLEHKAKRINEAYNVLVEVNDNIWFKKCKSSKKETVIIGLDELIKLYNGEVIDAIVVKGEEIKTVKFNRGNLNTMYTIIKIEYSYQFSDGRVRHCSNFIEHNMKDNYEIYLGIDNKIDSDILLSILDRTDIISKDDMLVQKNYIFDAGIKLKVIIERVAMNE